MFGFFIVLAVDWLNTNAWRNRRTLTVQTLHSYEKSSRLEFNTKKIIRFNSKCQDQILIVTIGSPSPEEVDKCVYRDSERGSSSGTDKDISRRVYLARGALVKLKPVWNSTVYRYKIKPKLFQSNVPAVLLYDAEHDVFRLNRFQRGCLRNIFLIF